MVIAFGEYSTGNVINSQEQAFIKLVLILVTAGVGVPLGLFAISRYGVIGLPVTLILDGVPSTIIGLVFVKRRYHVTIDWASSGKILLSSAVAGVLAYFTVTEIRLPSVIQLLLGVAIFLFSYIGMIVLTRGINSADTINLREMTRGLGPMGKLVNAILGIDRKIDGGSKGMMCDWERRLWFWGSSQGNRKEVLMRESPRCVG